MKPTIALLAALLAGGLAFGIGILSKLNRLEEQMAPPVPEGTMSQARDLEGSARAVDPLEALELRSIEELAAVLKPHANLNDIQRLARDCAEVDTWMFPPEAEKTAGNLVEKALELLRQRILAKTRSLDSQALKANSGAQADSLFSEGTGLIQLFPMPSTAKGQQGFEVELRRRAEVSRRIQEIRHLRYNCWAVAEIEKGYKMFHENLRTFNDGEEDQNLVRTTGGALAEIDPDALTPSVLELYMGLLRQTYDQISEKHRVELAKALNDPQVKRKSIQHF
jgi:hypothetical protein